MESDLARLKARIVDPSTTVSALLREALILAHNYNSTVTQEWIAKELQGYKANDVPEYRRIGGRLGVQTRFGMSPLEVTAPDVIKLFKNFPCLSSAPQIESVLSGSDGMMLALEMGAQVAKILVGDEHAPLIYGYDDRFALRGILDAVRTRLLDWVVSLPESETAIASRVSQSLQAQTIVTQTFHGPVTNVTGANIFLGKRNELIQDIGNSSLLESQKQEITKLVEGIASAQTSDEHKSFFKKGVAWVGSNYKDLGELAIRLMEYFSNR